MFCYSFESKPGSPVYIYSWVVYLPIRQWSECKNYYWPAHQEMGDNKKNPHKIYIHTTFFLKILAKTSRWYDSQKTELEFTNVIVGIIS